ncbi:Protein mak11 [Lecanicillium sp. MT-2017a]|nr:Protein mak11 [Lecanicillium sp. MT-2017a]
MAKRKRQAPVSAEPAAAPKPQSKKQKAAASESPSKPAASSSTPASVSSASETIQIIVGSYDQVLHGMTATIEKDAVEFADTFLFSAHSSAIRCLAVSPPSNKIPGQTQKVLLASGSTDERIHVYNLSAHPPSRKNQDALSQVAPRPILENPKNRELGTLLHHSSTITSLAFPSRSKLLSSSEDSTIAVTRTRDWSMLTTVKAPIPTAYGRPSGDTAPFGGTPSGVNDFAIHPSMKLMISVSKGEKSMRLWNLVTGKKAGVLNFSREMLNQAGEGKHSSGEGRRLAWGTVDGADEFAVGFDRDVVVFGMDSVPKCRVMPTKTKVHQFSYITLENGRSLMAVSTEDGRVLFLSTKEEDLTREGDDEDDEKLPVAKLVGFVGGKDNGVTGRIKDFMMLRSQQSEGRFYVVGASSDGKVRVWTVADKELGKATGKSVGKLTGMRETHNRITCLAGFVMIPKPDDAEESEEEDLEDEEGGEESDSESD